AAFANLRRWLAPGGRVAFAVWGPLDDNAWMAATHAAVADVIDLPPLESAEPGPFRYGDAESLVSLLARAGFVDVTVTDWRQPLAVGGGLRAPDAAAFAVAAFSSFAELLSDAGGDAALRACRGLTERFAPYERDGVILMPARVHIIAGRSATLGEHRP
ncbi:MAG: class I SAM-dependent methyltransferase, partial [Vicinamibacterales bacterium]